MEILSFFYHYLESPSQKKYLLALSGGVDSMVLFHLLLKAGFYFEVCHVNFQLRGKESEDDQNFVETICQKHGILCHSIRVDTLAYAKENDLSKQEAARKIRYDAFQSLCQERELDFIITAHHLNDQTENLIYTLIKSSYHRIFENIPPSYKNILRPLSPYTKQEILEYANQYQIPYREDSSNLKNDYARNKIRNQVIPILKEIHPNLENFLNKKWKNYALKEEFLHGYFQKIYEKIAFKVHSKVQVLKISTEIHSKELLLFFQFLIDHIFYLKVVSDEQLLNLWLNSPKGKQLIDKEWVIFKEKEGISFVHLNVLNFSEERILEKSGVYTWNIFEINLNEEQNFPLKIRKWKTGDRFHHQKLSDYFTRRYYPTWLKKLAYVIEDKNGKIVKVISNAN